MSLFLINTGVFSCEYCEIFKSGFFFQLERKFVKKVIQWPYSIIGNNAQNSLQLRQPENFLFELITSIKPQIIGRFRKVRRNSLFTQGKESGRRFIITFYQLYVLNARTTFLVYVSPLVKILQEDERDLCKSRKIAHKRSKFIVSK